ncbi:MAG: chemotaxis-specific protein-glutamate methyltransferase CheB [Bdellovibrionales bacterium]|nr:chemotaxis-specific protein-glutamate methyltransferase CheB [Bdellovibrionales bacterium]
MCKLKVLIADDSVVYRSQIRLALTNISDVEIVGACANGRQAIDRMRQSPVDLLILDLEMPELDGLQTLREMARLGLSTKTLVFSSLSQRGAEITLEALRSGASDFVPKPGPNLGKSPADHLKELLEPKIRAFFPPAENSPGTRAVSVPRANQYPHLIWDLFNPQIVVIASSTGGPAVLETIFTSLPKEITVPILLVQHMPPIFTTSLASRLTKLSGLEVKEGENGETLKKGSVYIAPGDFHMALAGSQKAPNLQITRGPQENFVRPAADPLFRSAAGMFKEKCLGIVLTGMGSDGKQGAQKIKEAGGAVIIQTKETCTVFGMPGAVHDCGAYDQALAPLEIAAMISEKVRPSSESPRLERKGI